MTETTDPDTKIADAALRQDADLSQGPMTNEGAVAVRSESVPAVHVEQTMDDFIAMALRDPSIDAGKLKALLDMKREVLADQAKVEFNKALHAAQAEIPQVEKLGTVKLGKAGEDKGSYAFARWEDMDKVLRPIMDRYGFTLRFDMEQRTTEGGGAKVMAILSHVAGHRETASISLALDAGPGRNNLQAMGSTLSYSKRYLAEMLFNIVRKGQDTDGVGADKKFVTQEQEDEILTLLKTAGREQHSFLPRMCTDVRSAAEIDVKDFIRVKGALQEIIASRQQKTGAAP